jgi:mRNA interferase MazF
LLRRGDILALPSSRGAKGHERRGNRYGIVVQSSDLDGLSTVILAPTSTGARPSRIRPAVTVRGRETRLLLEQVRAVDRTRLGAPIGHLTVHELDEVDEALKLVLGVR